MRTKKQLWNSHFGNKGFVFTLDALVAVVVAFILLAVANYYITKSSEDTFADLQMIRTGSDIITILDHIKSLDTLNPAIIEQDLAELLPEKYGIRLELSWEDAETSSPGSTTVGDPLPTKKFIATGKRFFLVTVDEAITDYGMVRYWIWLK